MTSSTDYPQLIQQFVRDQHLPAHYEEDAKQWFLPLKDRLLAAVRSNPGTMQIIGINGAQGTGKSTLAKLLARLLKADGLSVVSLSIDDFYFPGDKRAQLAAEIHPMLKTRGVPGTHDMTLAINTLQTLRSLSDIETLPLPEFDKSSDEPVPNDEWVGVSGPVDLVIFEGWFVGVQPEDSDSLERAVNLLETERDPDGRWRKYVNQKLAGDYQCLFSMLDQLILLQAPGFEQVYEWRALQEQKLRDQRNTGAGIMNDAELTQFIQQFERLTRHCLTTLPARADVVFELDTNHRVKSTNQAG